MPFILFVSRRCFVGGGIFFLVVDASSLVFHEFESS